MIRTNLLEGLRHSQTDGHAALPAHGPSAFSSRREAWLAALLLAASVLILYVIVSLQFSPPAYMGPASKTPVATPPAEAGMGR